MMALIRKVVKGKIVMVKPLERCPSCGKPAREGEIHRG